MTQTRVNVDIYSDIACPWCYIGKRRFEKAVAALPFSENIDVTWHAFQLDPSAPEHFEGSGIDYFVNERGMEAEKVAGMLEHVSAQAADEGLAFDMASVHPTNSFTALRLLALAKEHDLGDAMKEALLSAHFEKGVDTGSRRELQLIADTVGLDHTESAAVLSGDEYADAVHADGVRGRELGVTGVPFFVLGDKYGISGAQPTEVFEQALKQVWEEASAESKKLQPIGSTTADGEACGPKGCD